MSVSIADQSGKVVRPGGFLIPGLSLVFVTIYAPFYIAPLLSDRVPGIPLGYYVATAFLSMAIGTAISAKTTATGLLVAPAVGMVVFFQKTGRETISSSEFLLACLLAGLIALWLSRPKENKLSLRQTFLDNIPSPVKVGVRGGIGALLATAAVENLDLSNASYSRYIVGCFVASVTIILLAEVLQGRLEIREATLRFFERGVLIAVRSIYFIVPLLIFLFFWFVGAVPLSNWAVELQLPNALPMLDWTAVPSASVIRESLVVCCFAAIILFIFLTDIPGSPYDVLSMSNLRDDERTPIIGRSFVVTSAMSIFNPLVGLLTSVYYTENHVVIQEGRVDNVALNPKIAAFCASVFAILFFVFLFIEFPVDDINRWLLVAVSPVLFCLGIRLTARALFEDANEEKKHIAEELKISLQQQGVYDSAKMIGYYIPVAFTILLTHFVGFELSLPLGIFYHRIYMLASAQKTEQKTASWLVVASGLIVVILGAFKLGLH
jgi:hypothetical protein